MLILSVLVGFLAAAALRMVFVLFQLRSFDPFLYELEKHEGRYWLAVALDTFTLLGFTIPAIYAMVTQNVSPSDWNRIGAIFVVWLGVAILMRFPVQQLRRQTQRDLKINILTNAVMALLNALLMTSLYVAYCWWTEQ